jgi:lambda family phage portal protein
MGLLDSVTQLWRGKSPSRSLSSVSHAPWRRHFKAGNVTRLTKDWPILPQQINTILLSQGRQLRARSRHLVMNDPYASNFVAMKQRNIVGHNGVTMQAKVKNLRGDGLNDKLNKSLEDAFATWSLPQYCTVKKDMHFSVLQQFLAGQTPTDGEFFVQRVVDKTSPFGIRLRVIDPDQLDTGYNTQIPLANGNIVVMGVELNAELAPVAYHFFKPNLFVGASQPRERVRVDAADIIHYFRPWFPNQVRGIPDMAPSMYRMNMLSGYEDAEATAARLGATKAGFFFNEKGTTDFQGEVDRTDKDSFIDEAEPGQFDILPEGWKFQSYDPTHPSTAYPAFMKTGLRAVAAGFGVDYPTFANDLENVNLSSMRGGLLETRDGYRMEQQRFIWGFIQRVAAWLIEAWDLKGVIQLGKVTREQAQMSLVWTPRRWAWIDPLKDVQAAVLERENGLNTLSNQLAERGMDYEETIDTLAQEQVYAKKKGVKLGADLKGDTTGDGVGQDGDEGGEGDGDKSDDAGGKAAGKE